MKRSEFCDEFLLLDLTNKKNADIAVKGVDYVYNLAANMGGIGYITKYYADIKKILFSSSACVYPEYLQNKTHHELEGRYRLVETNVFPADPDSF